MNTKPRFAGRLWLCSALWLSCAHTTGVSEPNLSIPAESQEFNAEAVKGVEDPGLKALLHEHWEAVMVRNPEWATALGDHRFDTRISNRSLESLEEWTESTRGWVQRLHGIARTGLSVEDRTTVELLLHKLESELAIQSCEFEFWSFSPRHNPLVDVNYLAEIHPVLGVEDGQNLVARYRASESLFGQEESNLRAGLAKGRVANAESVRRVISMGRRQLESPLDQWPQYLKAVETADAWSESDRTDLLASVKGALEEVVRPALEQYLTFLEEEVLEHARGDGASGLVHAGVPESCYDALVHQYTTLSLAPSDVHQRGLDELERIHAEMSELASAEFGNADVQALFQRLRTDPALFFQTSQEVEDKARSALAVAEERVPEVFGRLPTTSCEVRRVPAFEAPYTTIAYYQPAAPDGSRPGVYYVNVHEPQTRPRFEAEVLAFHESVPGHHFQISIAQGLPDLPAVRRHMGMTVFVEGWALYTERLANELGLYSGPLDRLGMLSFDSWRAGRLVVDTGIHHLGWSRTQAEEFLLANTPLAANNIANEVDRYITWPGQALAYKVGQLEIVRLRGQAEEALGPDFDLATFHDLVLGGGAVSIPILERRVVTWIEDSRTVGTEP
ncbi:MAG: DUF885 domain-containing protein [Myxococcota bacterium]|nr:DUF885 domain-containing protein [Myxococcota bacterium]